MKLYFDVKQLKFVEGENKFQTIKKINFKEVLNLTKELNFNFLYDRNGNIYYDILEIRIEDEEKVEKFKKWFNLRIQELYYKREAEIAFEDLLN